MFYLAATGVHSLSFAYLSFFFRFRRVTAVPTLAISAGYMAYFQIANNALYKILVDKPVMAEMRALKLDAHVQPVGTTKVRNITFK